MKKALALAVAVLLLAALSWIALDFTTGNWSGVDEIVVERIAKEAGRPARDPYINTDQGNLLLLVFLLAGACGGFAAGYFYRALFPLKRRGAGIMMQPFDLFFDYFAMRDNALRRLDARTKTGTAAALFLAILSSTRPSLPAVVSVVSIAGLIALKIPPGLICRRFLSPLGAVLVIAALQAVLIGETPVFSISLAGWELAVKREGLEHGMLVGLRVWGAVSVLLLLSSVTPAHEIFQTLRWCRMPKVWLEIAMLIYRYLFVFLDEASEMVTAQRVRLGYSGFRNSLSSMGGLMGAVVVRSVEQSLRTHEAMIARGYTGEFPFSPMTGMPRHLRLALLGATLSVAFIYLAAEGWLW